MKAPFPMRITYELEDAGSGTRVRIRAQGDASGFYRLAAAALSGIVKRDIAQDLAQLKQTLESR